jgi:hypothetical protein
MKLNVFGMQVNITRTKNLAKDQEATGKWLPTKKTIQLDSDIQGEDYYCALLHETIHAVASRLGWHNAELSHDLEEIIADNIATCIVENFDIKLKSGKRKRI